MRAALVAFVPAKASASIVIRPCGTMKTEYEQKKVSLTVDVTALVTKEDSPGRSALLGLSLPLQHL
jgi:hypothetical protein